MQRNRDGDEPSRCCNHLVKGREKEFCQFLHDLKVPSGYSSNFKRIVSVKDMKINFNLMKSHDWACVDDSSSSCCT
jgi:hypothetical protein